MKSLVACLMGLMIFIQSDATQQPTVSGHVRLSSGLPVVGAQVMLFDVADLRRGVVAHATTDEAGQFALPLAALGRLALPQGFALGTNYPNPFNPATIIPYELAATSPVKLEVFNILGQWMATLVDGEQGAGSYQAQWDGTDAAGQAAAAGLYFYRLTVDGVPQTGRMVLVDGQAGVPMSGAGVESLSAAESLNEAYGTYGLVVSGPGMVAHVDAEFGVEAGMGPVDIAVEARRDGRMQETPSGMLGDVDNNGQVDIADGLLVAAYSVNPATALPNNGDVNGDNQTDITDAWLLATYKGDLAALGLSGRGKAVGTLSSDVFISDDFSSGNLNKWTTQGGGSGSIEVEDGALKLVGTAGGNYTIRVSKEIFPTKTYANYVLSFDWKVTIKETPYGITFVRALFYNSADERIGQLIALNAGDPNRSFEDHGGHLLPGHHGGVFKKHESFGWERVTINTSTATPLLNMGDVHRILIQAEVYNDAGSGGDLYVDNLSFEGFSGGGGSPRQEKTFALSGGASMEFVRIEPGTFQMGAPASESGRWDDEGPVHEVEISRGFWLGKYEVTQGEWEAVMGSNPSQHTGDSRRPVEHVSWYDVHEFIGRLNDAAGDSLYRLPSEAEWEYACRAGSTTRFSFGDDESQLTDYAWYYGNARNVGEDYTHAVGTKLPNAWGLYDMHGNVWEWVQDWFEWGYYNSSPRVDPLGPTSGAHRVGRGGSFAYTARHLRVANRIDASPNYRDDVAGFRLLRVDSASTPDPGQPDLVVSSAWVDDSTPSEGDRIRMDVTVRNQGDATASSSSLHYYWSNNDTYSSDDTYIDDDGVRNLDPGETDDEYESGISVDFTGTRYLIACADAEYDVSESNENNNCAAVRVDVDSSQPDLEAGSGSVSNSRPSPGATITVSVPVTNVGSARSSKRGMIFFVSTNDRDAKDASDDFVEPIEAIDVPWLNPGATTTISKTFSVPSSSGTYYYIACVGTHSEESNNDNDCSDGLKAVEVTVVDSSQPDLEAGSGSVSNSRPSPGATITVSVPVTNVGSARSSKRGMIFFVSTNDRDAKDASDDFVEPIEAIDVPWLNPGATTTISKTFSVPSSSGTYYYIACVGTHSEESNNDNDCSDGLKAVEVIVGDSSQPDLVVSAAWVDDSTPSVGDAIRVDATVRNQGTATASASRLRYYWSTDATYSSDDTYIDYDGVRSLDPGETDDEYENIPVLPTPGTYYLIVCADAEYAVSESNENNNCEVVRVDVSGGGDPDLVVSSVSMDDDRPSAGDRIRMYATVRNRGDATASSSRLHYYRSNDATYSSDDTYLDYDNVPSLDANETGDENEFLDAPSSSGTYYYIACADAEYDVSESNENNNCAAVRVVVPGGDPDLVVSSASMDDDTPSAGDRIRMYVTVRNRGDVTASRSVLKYYRSNDDTYSSDDTYLDYDNVPSLDPGETEDENERLDAPSSSGTYYIIACADANNDVSESNENNNCAAVRVVVSGGGSEVNIGDLSTPYVYGSSNDSVNRNSNDKDYYRFTLTQQRTMLLELRDLSGDADLFLEDANKNVLASSSSGGTGNREIYHSLEAGTYYIRVDADASGTINYRLRYRSEYVVIENFGDITSSTVTVTLPTGHVNKSSNDRDYFSFTLSSTRTVRIELINLSGDADLVLENNERTVIDSSTLSGTTNELIVKSLGSGYYRIGVKAFASGTISYQLRYSIQR